MNLFKRIPTKAQEQQLKIIEAAIYSFVAEGVQGTTYAALAKKCGVSRPLIHHYYPELRQLIEASATYVRSVMQDHVVMAMLETNERADRQLRAYVQSCFSWLEKYPVHYKFWLLFFYQCGINQKSRSEHSELTEMGQQRIKGIVELGADQALWKVKDSKKIAKMIQSAITGTMMMVMTENITSIKEIEKLAVDQIHLLLGFTFGRA